MGGGDGRRPHHRDDPPARRRVAELYFVDLERDDGAIVSLVLRCEGGGSFSGTEVSPAKEAVVYRALAETPVPVPLVVGVAPGGAALLMERVPGIGDLTEVDDDERAVTMASFVDALAALHSLDVDTLTLDGFARPSHPGDQARLDLEMWAKLADDGVPDLDPFVRYAGAWLHAHPPVDAARTVLVQGDTGPGNFVFENGKVTGIVDWEFAHLGDPMDDWAWLDMRMRDAWICRGCRSNTRGRPASRSITIGFATTAPPLTTGAR